MCIFNTKVGVVRSTKILVAATAKGRQVTVYENAVSVVGGNTRKPGQYGKKAALEEQVREERNNNAMILPCPLTEGSDIIPLNLSRDSFSFANLDKGFPEKPQLRSNARGSTNSFSFEKKLEVVQIGAYSVSIAKSLVDLSRIDTGVFKVNESILPALRERYSVRFGFVICAFNPANKIEPHPIGYVHDPPESKNLFVPTLHIHDGKVHQKENFDQNIYSVNTDEQSGQSPADLEKAYKTKPQKSVKAELKSKILNKDITKINNIRRMSVQGKKENVNYILKLFN
eukprot:TRINITY_DN5756_c0_g1_i1.p1 TRINITY_DN5756_c0_g1~~TRINITY_DN5756_c0_g1_i1.p1  ORF type:complete len:285 (-),score=44.64 TRINITY_DN5756_c0_g1_i1:87-941(-)